MIDTVHDVVGVGNKNSSDKDKVKGLHLLVDDGMKRQSEQDMPQPMVSNGIMDGTQMGGTEQCANVLALVIALKTKAGRSLINKH